MTKQISIFLILLVLVVSMVSCLDETTPTAISKITVQVAMPHGIKDTVHYANRYIILKSNRLEYKVLTDSLGKAVFENVVPDIYSVSTSWEISGDQYIAYSDTIVENKGVIFSGSLAKEQLFSEKTLQLALTKSIKQSLLISKIYASGTKDALSKNYTADAYIEIFNNSDETQYVDGLYLGLVEAESVIAFPASANPTFIHARQIFRFPGGGMDNPILPGKSIVIANSAINHTIAAPTSVDLSTADFEAKSTKFSNNSNVKTFELIFTAYASLLYMNLTNGGDNGTFLFKTNDDISTYPIEYIPGKVSGNRYIRVPAETVIDGVEVLKNKAVTGPDVNAKRLQNFIDAGYMFISAISGYTHESVDRKVDTGKSAVRIYLRDTNNSLNDFKSVTDPSPRKYDKPLLLE